MKKIAIGLFLTSIFAGTMAYAADQHIIMKSEALEWQPAKGLKGAEVAILSGNPEKNEPFIARVKLPAHFQLPVHTHNMIEYDTVISGALYLGAGATAAADRVQEMSAGSFFMIPAQLEHYGWTKEETVLQINGVGPWGMVYKSDKK
jgi:quercetin dioxygenase-like cupin family protein